MLTGKDFLNLKEPLIKTHSTNLAREKVKSRGRFLCGRAYRGKNRLPASLPGKK